MGGKPKAALFAGWWVRCGAAVNEEIEQSCDFYVVFEWMSEARVGVSMDRN
jgi:hypothetical protein